jgi:hypothetical protein
MNGTQYIDSYDKQLNERKLAILRALGLWWTASTKGQEETKARENVSIQIQGMRDYLDELEADLLKAEVTS